MKSRLKEKNRIGVCGAHSVTHSGSAAVLSVNISTD